MKFLKIFMTLSVALALLAFVPGCGDEDDLSPNEENTVPDEPEPEPDEPEPEPDPDDPSSDPDEDDEYVDDGILKVLCIGNSFTEDGVGQYLWELFDAAGMSDTIIAYLYIGSSTLKGHYGHMTDNDAEYSYRKIVNGNKTITSDKTMIYGILDEDWDYISFQQSSANSGRYDTYMPYLSELAQYALENCTNKNVQLVFYQTWAYPQDTTDSSFSEYYQNDQMYMYNAIVSAVNQASAEAGIEIIVPAGTAIQNGRNSYMGDVFNRDDRHLEYTYGRYTAACTWFETLSGIDVTTNTYAPAGVDADTKAVVSHAAHYAVLNPNEVDPMTDWQVDPGVPDGVSSRTTEFSFTKGGGSRLFAISASDSWTVTAPDWVTVDPSSGSNGKNIQVSLTVAANGDGTERTGEVKFALTSGEHDTATVTINQDGSDAEEWYYDDFEWTRPYAEAVNQQDVVATNEYGTFGTTYIDEVSVDGISAYDDFLARGYTIKSHSGKDIQNVIIMPGYLLFYCNSAAHLQAVHLPKLTVAPEEGTPVWIDLEWCPSTNKNIKPDTVNLTVEITNGDVTKTFDSPASTAGTASLVWTNHVFEVEGVTIDENTDICIRPIDTYWDQSGDTNRRYLLGGIKVYTPKD